jgi:enoyl reductase
MRAVIPMSLIGRGLVLAGVAVVATAGTAFANGEVSKTGGSSNHGNIGAQVQGVSITTSNKPGSRSKPINSSGASWTPPPCWIGPLGGPAEFKKMVEKQVKDTDDYPGQPSYAMQAMDEYRRHYEEGYTWDGGGDGYKNFNLDQEGKGKFWGAIENPNSDSPDRFNCNSTLPMWVPNGQLPPGGTPNVITTDMLARIAADHTQVPGVEIKTNPRGTQTVNLPTWVKLRENFAPVVVRASVDLGGGATLWAETTAETHSVHIDPGTPDAQVFPGGGDCPVGANGTVGADYGGNPKATPPCGVTYQRSTQNRGPFQLNVSAVWGVTWRGSDGASGDLGNGTVSDPTPVTVREIQAVNR